MSALLDIKKGIWTMSKIARSVMMAASVVVFLTPLFAAAQGLEEIVVTARKR